MRYSSRMKTYSVPSSRYSAKVEWGLCPSYRYINDKEKIYYLVSHSHNTMKLYFIIQDMKIVTPDQFMDLAEKCDGEFDHTFDETRLFFKNKDDAKTFITALKMVGEEIETKLF